MLLQSKIKNLEAWEEKNKSKNFNLSIGKFIFLKKRKPI